MADAELGGQAMNAREVVAEHIPNDNGTCFCYMHVPGKWCDTCMAAADAALGALVAACDGDYVVISKADWKLLGLEMITQDESGCAPTFWLIDPEGETGGE